MKDEQIKLLAREPNVVIPFDGDKPDQKAGAELGERRAPFTNVILIPLPDGEDPDTLSAEYIKKVKSIKL